jgi:predicted metal-dependent hydrolase
MSISNLIIQSTFTVSDIPIQVIRKPIKNLHLSVSPDGQVQIAAPLHLSDDQLRLAVITRLSWIKKQQATFQAQPRQTDRQMVTGETHYLFGHRYRLEVIERQGRHEIVIKNHQTILLFVKPGTSTANRIKVLNHWYRQQLQSRIPDLIDRWLPKIGRSLTDWRIKKMKTKWGSCNIAQSRIWLNLELAKKPIECLEYVIVHELVHLLERSHGDRFKDYMDKFLPQWRLSRDILNGEPLEQIS